MVQKAHADLARNETDVRAAHSHRRGAAHKQNFYMHGTCPVLHHVGNLPDPLTCRGLAKPFMPAYVTYVPGIKIRIKWDREETRNENTPASTASSA